MFKEANKQAPCTHSTVRSNEAGSSVKSTYIFSKIFELFLSHRTGSMPVSHTAGALIPRASPPPRRQPTSFDLEETDDLRHPWVICVACIFVALAVISLGALAAYQASQAAQLSFQLSHGATATTAIQVRLRMYPHCVDRVDSRDLDSDIGKSSRTAVESS